MCILEVENLSKSYEISAPYILKKKRKTVVSKFSMKVKRGKTIGLVGDSGCGKSTIARCLVNIEEADSGIIKIDGKTVYSKGMEKENINLFNELDTKKKIQIILQDSYASLNPKRKIGKMICEALMIHEKTLSKKEAEEIVCQYMELCGLEKNFFNRYPHELSGGQRQRVCVVRALVLKPEIIICDEITSALDVSVQAKILNLMLDLKEKFNLTYIFISHDKDVVECFCDRIINL
ncbi:ATP-binding cassette domain-containing protein [Peptostreptococcus russellii]|uniref:Peptide/nickel transport system ATP-binding protein n=1 Tax=Peptostreptococcus russellii TaxID=215200 RepID=A0A1H8JMY5_9FIRM|nr:dipeptide/oligopeptide/nickel ABC transporter ATP-binding protein [Peptostreptococcus russellii]SEN81598.1 peptide/nickel transport system ATP-binding protein [Peptostreptococcus russellii]